MTDLKLREAVAVRVMGLPKRMIPEDKRKFGHVDPTSDLWRNIVLAAIDARVVLSVQSAYKGAHYGADFDGWHLSYSIPYADAYKADDELRMGGTPIEEWTHGYEPGVYVSVADFPAYESDIAAAWLVVERMNALGWDVDMHTYDITSKAKPCVLLTGPEKRHDHLAGPYEGDTLPEAICRAALAALSAEESNDT